ncbi:MAG: 50S ribosomal protein L15 [Cocleimonas sp.]
MKLNTMKPALGSTTDRKRVGRGIGCGWGKTCGRGHKGQKARSGGFTKVGFEGGQMPLQRRLPKVGFTSRIGRVSSEVRLSELNALEADVINLEILKSANVVTKNTLHVKVMLSGSVDKAINLKGIKVSKGAREAIEAAGGKIED